MTTFSENAARRRHRLAGLGRIRADHVLISNPDVGCSPIHPCCLQPDRGWGLGRQRLSGRSGFTARECVSVHGHRAPQRLGRGRHSCADDPRAISWQCQPGMVADCRIGWWHRSGLVLPLLGHREDGTDCAGGGGSRCRDSSNCDCFRRGLSGLSARIRFHSRCGWRLAYLAHRSRGWTS